MKRTLIVNDIPSDDSAIIEFNDDYFFISELNETVKFSQITSYENGLGMIGYLREHADGRKEKLYLETVLSHSDWMNKKKEVKNPIE